MKLTWKATRLPLRRLWVISVIASSTVQMVATFRTATSQLLDPTSLSKKNLLRKKTMYIWLQDLNLFHGFSEQTNFGFALKFPSQHKSNSPRTPVWEKAVCVNPVTGLQKSHHDGHSFPTVEWEDFSWASLCEQLALRPSDTNSLLESTLHSLQCSSCLLLLHSVSSDTCIDSDRYFRLLERTVWWKEFFLIFYAK